LKIRQKMKKQRILVYVSWVKFYFRNLIYVIRRKKQWEQ